MFEKEKIMLKI